MITINQKGNFDNLEKYLKNLDKTSELSFLEKYGQMGVKALADATPYDSGKTAASWKYIIERNGNTTSLQFHNTNINKGVNIAVILQYGHGTGTGGYVQGRDYINPVVRPLFDEILEEALKEVK